MLKLKRVIFGGFQQESTDTQMHKKSYSLDVFSGKALCSTSNHDLLRHRVQP